MYVVVEKPSSNFVVQKQTVLKVRIAQFNIPVGVSSSEFTAKGDILVGTMAGGFISLPVGTNGYTLIADSTQPAGIRWALSSADLPRGYINGFTLSNNVTDPNNDIDISAGAARGNTNAANIVMAGSLTKQLDANWAVGNNVGGLDTGSKANSTWYYVFAIRNDVDGSADVLFSTSISSPTMPSGYTYKRRIGAIRTNGSGNIIGFIQLEKRFFWKSPPVLDVDVTNLGTTRTTYQLTVPLGVRLIVFVNTWYSHGSGSPQVLITNPEMTDDAPSSTAAPLATLRAATTGLDTKMELLTDTSGQIAARSTLTNTTLRVSTIGWVDFMLD